MPKVELTKRWRSEGLGYSIYCCLLPFPRIRQNTMSRDFCTICPGSHINSWQGLTRVATALSSLTWPIPASFHCMLVKGQVRFTIREEILLLSLRCISPSPSTSSHNSISSSFYFHQSSTSHYPRSLMLTITLIVLLLDCFSCIILLCPTS